MFNKSFNNNRNPSTLYNNILLLSRNKLFYTKFGLTDTFQNRINLIFLHISFLFIRIKTSEKSYKFKIFHQDVFDTIFKKIEINMREIGYGDVSVNKKMKILVKSFYNILLNCENYDKKNDKLKTSFLLKYLEIDTNDKNSDKKPLIDYFKKYQTFCFDLKSDSVLKGDFKFKY